MQSAHPYFSAVLIGSSSNPSGRIIVFGSAMFFPFDIDRNQASTNSHLVTHLYIAANRQKGDEIKLESIGGTWLTQRNDISPEWRRINVLSVVNQGRARSTRWVWCIDTLIYSIPAGTDDRVRAHPAALLRRQLLGESDRVVRVDLERALPDQPRREHDLPRQHHPHPRHQAAHDQQHQRAQPVPVRPFLFTIFFCRWGKRGASCASSCGAKTKF